MEINGLGRYLVELRQMRGWSITDAAAKIGMSKSHLSQLEKGKIGLPNAALRRQIAAAYNVGHIDVLVAAGELMQSEVDPDRTMRPFPNDEVRAEIVEKVAEIQDENALDILDTVRAIWTRRRRILINPASELRRVP